MNSKTTVSIVWQINARYRLDPSIAPMADEKALDVIDRARELQFIPAVIFSNGTETECREWVLRNCEEPVEYTPGDWQVAYWLGTINDGSHQALAVWPADIVEPFRGEPICLVSDSNTEDAQDKANAALISTAPKLLALLEQYHSSMPTKGEWEADLRGAGVDDLGIKDAQ